MNGNLIFTTGTP